MTDKNAQEKQTGKLSALSLFSGCGGMDLGLEGGFWCNEKSVSEELHGEWIADRKDGSILLAPTQFETVFANDIRSEAKTAWMSFFKDRKRDAESIYRTESVVDLVRRMQNGESVFPENVDIVTGGFPCQDFSVAGKRLGFESEKDHLGRTRDADTPSEESRGQLYMWMREVIMLTRPNMFIAENVKGLATLGGAKSVIESDFAKAGYLVVPAKVLRAKEYGIPQSRERIIFFGFRRDALTLDALRELGKEIIAPRYDPYPISTHGGEGKPYVVCADALAGLEEPEQSSDPSQKAYSKAKYMGDHCQGQTEVGLDSIAPTIRSEHHGNIEFRRLSEEHGGKHAEELSAGLPERRLTVRECARIQTFPDEYGFVGNGISMSAAYRLVGNAVPPVLAYNIARNIGNKWKSYFG